MNLKDHDGLFLYVEMLIKEVPPSISLSLSSYKKVVSLKFHIYDGRELMTIIFFYDKIEMNGK